MSYCRHTPFTPRQNEVTVKHLYSITKVSLVHPNYYCAVEAQCRAFLPHLI